MSEWGAPLTGGMCSGSPRGVPGPPPPPPEPPPTAPPPPPELCPGECFTPPVAPDDSGPSASPKSQDVKVQ